MGKTESFVKGVVLGTVVGAAAGILLAPKSGEETREDIKKLAVDLKDKAVDVYNEAKETVEKKIAALKKAGEDIDESKYKKLVSEVVDEFKNDAKVTSSAAKKLGEQLSSDWSNIKSTLKK